MTQEAPATEATTEAPAAPTQESAPAQEVETPAEAPTQESAPEAPESTSTPSFSDTIAAFEADDSPHREDFAKWSADREGSGYTKALELIRPQMQKMEERTAANEALWDRTHQGVKTMGGLIRTALDNGTLTEAGIANILESNPDALRAFTEAARERNEETQAALRKEGHDAGSQAARIASAWDTTKFIIEEGSKAVKAPSLLQEFTTRIEAAQKGEDDPVKVVTDWATSIRQKGYEAGRADRAVDDTESDNVETRAKQKPPQGIGSATGSGRLTKQQLEDMTPEEYGKIDPAERARLFAAAE